MTALKLENNDDQNDSEAVDRLVELLEFEVDRIVAEESRPGWTAWALVGSLASALWLLASELESSVVNLQNVLFLFLTFSLAYDCIVRWLPSLIWWQGSPETTPRFRPSHIVLAQGRGATLLEIGRSIALVVIAAEIRPYVSTPYVVAVYVVYVAVILLGLVGFCMSFLEIPVLPASGRVGWVARAMLAFLVGTGLLALLGLLGVFWRQAILPTVPEYRVGGLLLVIMSLLLVLAQRRPQTPVLRTLIGTRRNLVLGRISLDSARRQTEIALMGLTTADVLQHRVEELLAHLQHLDTHTEAMSKELQGARIAVGKDDDDAEISEVQWALILAVLQSGAKHLNSISEAMQRLSSATTGLTSRASAYTKIYPEAAREIQPLLEKVNAAFDETRATREGLSEELAGLDELLRTRVEKSKMQCT
jgi:hypothetical protein